MLAQLAPLVTDELDIGTRDIEAATVQSGNSEIYEPDDNDPLGRLVREIHRTRHADYAHPSTHDKGKHPPDSESDAV
jgi:hypothetical protein